MKSINSLLVALSLVMIPHAVADDGDRTIAWGVATQALLLNIESLPDTASNGGEKSYLLAGAHQFHTLWTRDFSYATNGMLAIGEDKAVHDSIEFLLAHQRADGLIGRTVDNVNIQQRVVLGIVGIVQQFKNPLQAWFETENHVIAIDSNVWLPVAASRYVLKTGDRRFARQWLPAVEKALAFLEKDYFVDGLIGKQPEYSDWEDSVKRTGRVAFTNVGYILALQGLSDWANFLGDKARTERYAQKKAATLKKFHDYFWMPEKKMLRNFEGDDVRLTADANLMAVANHLLSPQESLDVMNTLRHSPLWTPMPGRVTWPNYPDSLKDTYTAIGGIRSYHDAMYWLWITALAAMAEKAVGNCAGYDEIMDKLSHQIASDNEVIEVFDLKGGRLVPVSRILYQAETPFTWSSGMYLEAAARACD